MLEALSMFLSLSCQPEFMPINLHMAIWVFSIRHASRYGHTLLKTSDPVRSPAIKQQRDLSVVQWVTMRESRLPYFLLRVGLEGSLMSGRCTSFLARVDDFLVPIHGHLL